MLPIENCTILKYRPVIRKACLDTFGGARSLL